MYTEIDCKLSATEPVVILAAVRLLLSPVSRVAPTVVSPNRVVPLVGVLVFVGVLVGGTGVLVGGTGVFVGGTAMVGGTGVFVAGTGVLVGGTGVLVAEAD